VTDLYAKAGEQVTCENGHVICEAARDLHTFATWSPADWTNWTQPEPMPGTSLEACLCAICGARWVRAPGMIYHFADGWRDGRPDWVRDACNELGSQVKS
jgi:hypothetical protein